MERRVAEAFTTIPERSNLKNKGGGMMKFQTKKSNGPWLGLIMGIVIFGFVLWGIGFSLGTEDRILQILLYIPTYLFLVVYVYLLLGAFNLSYSTTEESFNIRWGVHGKKIPWEAVDEVILIKGQANLYPFLGASWPGYMIGLYTIKGLGPVRMYGTKIEDGFLYLKTQRGFCGLTPRDDSMMAEITQRTGKALQIIDMDEVSVEQKGKRMQDDGVYKLYYRLNILFLAAFAVYIAIFFPGSGASPFVVLLLVLAFVLFLFNMSNSSRLFQFSPQGGYITLLISLFVTGIFIILSISEISL